jgi:hypothetical protein
LTGRVGGIGAVPLANLSVQRHWPSVSRRRDSNRSYTWAVWLSLIGVLLPPKAMSILVGVNFTPGRICLIVLLVPSICTLFARGYRPQPSDFLALSVAVWIAIAAVQGGGVDALLTAAGGESLEFLGAYLAGRAFLASGATLTTFVRVLKTVTILVVLLALADTVTGRWFIQDTLGSIFNGIPPGPVYRNDIVRATSTLDHPILLGTFLSLAAAIFINLGGSGWSRTVMVLVCLFGCLLAQSSAGLMSWGIVVVVFFYDRALKSYPWRWGLLWSAFTGLICATFLFSNAPLGWFLNHLTLDPASAYFRYMIWDAALDQIGQTPIFGFTGPMSAGILNITVDSVWLVYALRFGLPTILFLFLANLTAILPAHNDRKYPAGGPLAKQKFAFSMVLIIFMFTGFTVHFWNYLWIFWGLCLGIRASLRLQNGATA